MDRRASCRFVDFGLARTVAAIADVIADAVVEQHRILRNDADRAAQRILGDRTDILPIDRDPPPRNVVDAITQTQNRRFASHTMPDTRHISPERPAQTTAL